MEISNMNKQAMISEVVKLCIVQTSIVKLSYYTVIV